MVTIYQILLRALLLFLMVGSAAGLLTGMALIIRPEWVVRLGLNVNRWFSTRWLERTLDKSFKVDRYFYRHSRPVGAVLLAGAIYLIYFCTRGINNPGITLGLSRKFAVPPVLMEVLLDSVFYAWIAASALALIISLFLLIRPSMLRGFEQGANRWFSSRRSLKPFEIPRSGVDEYVLQHAQRAGVLLVLGSLYALAVLAIWVR